MANLLPFIRIKLQFDMNGFFKIIAFSFGLFIGVTACETVNNNNSSQQPSSTKIESSDNQTKEIIPEAIPRKDCEIKGKILEGNRKLVKGKNAMVCIVANDSTKDEKLGDSHRVIELYDTRSCNLIKKETLPINVSPDFPYFIADIIYNKNSNLVAIKGHGVVYCYDVNNQKLLEALIPEFKNERIAADAQSGMIKHLEVWENYLIGYAMDIGAFVFDLTDTENAKALLPAAEYDLSLGEGEDFSSLFFLRSNKSESTYQAILPNYEGSFNINPLFDAPKNVNPTLSKNVSDNRFIVLKNQDGTPYAIDMESQKNVALPSEVKGQSTQEILKWLKK